MPIPCSSVAIKGGSQIAQRFIQWEVMRDSRRLEAHMTFATRPLPDRQHCVPLSLLTSSRLVTQFRVSGKETWFHCSWSLDPSSSAFGWDSLPSVLKPPSSTSISEPVTCVLESNTTGVWPDNCLRVSLLFFVHDGI